MKHLIFIIFVLFLLIGCSATSNIKSNNLDDRANALAKKNIIVDGHIDLPYRLRVKNFRLEKEYIGIPVQTDEGDFDFVRSKEGGLDAPFMSIYIPAKYQEEGGAKKLADSLINMVEFIANEQSDKFVIAKTTEDVEKAFAAGKVALPMGMENGAGIEDNLDNVAYFDRRGISYITLTHSRDNLICDSSYDTTRTWNGLSEFGKMVVAEMNRVGIMVDISHVSDSAFYDVLEIVDLPVIASHSSARRFVPGFERNMSDEMIQALGQNGGVIMVNFGSTFLDGEIRRMRDKRREEISALLERKGATWNSDMGKAMIKEYEKNNPNVFSDVKKVADHIDLIVQLAGIDHVGFGSDYDGVGDSLPTGLKDVSDYPNLIKELLNRGYSDEDIRKICYKNLFRVWNAVEEYAQKVGLN
ncbi:MAG: dipeptidase [Bacteroidota bacterium]